MMTDEFDEYFITESLNSDYSKFAEKTDDEVLLWGIWKNVDQTEVLENKYTSLEQVWDDLYFGKDSKGHSVLIFDCFEKIIDISEDLTTHYNRLGINESCEVNQISVVDLPHDPYHYFNVPFLEGDKVLMLKGIIGDKTYYGCMRMRSNTEHHSTLIVPVLYDELLFSCGFVSAKRSSLQEHSSVSYGWEFYSYFRVLFLGPHEIETYHGGRRYICSSQRPADSIPFHVNLLLFSASKEEPVLYKTNIIEDVYGQVYPVPFSENGYYVIKDEEYHGDRVFLPVTVVDKVIGMVDSNSLITVKNGMYGISGNGVELDFSYDSIIRVGDSFKYLIVKKFGKTGIFDKESGTFISPIFDRIDPVPIDCWALIDYDFIVELNNLHGVLNSAGNVIVPLAYNQIEVLSYYKRNEACAIEDVLYKTRYGSHYGVYGLFEPLFDDLKFFVTTTDIPYFGLKNEDGWCIADHEGNLLTEHEFESIDYSKAIDCFVFKKNGSIGTIAIAELKNK